MIGVGNLSIAARQWVDCISALPTPGRYSREGKSWVGKSGEEISQQVEQGRGEPRGQIGGRESPAGRTKLRRREPCQRIRDGESRANGAGEERVGWVDGAVGRLALALSYLSH